MNNIVAGSSLNITQSNRYPYPEQNLTGYPCSIQRIRLTEQIGDIFSSGITIFNTNILSRYQSILYTNPAF